MTVKATFRTTSLIATLATKRTHKSKHTQTKPATNALSRLTNGTPSVFTSVFSSRLVHSKKKKENVEKLQSSGRQIVKEDNGKFPIVICRHVALWGLIKMEDRWKFYNLKADPR